MRRSFCVCLLPLWVVFACSLIFFEAGARKIRTKLPTKYTTVEVEKDVFKDSIGQSQFITIEENDSTCNFDEIKEKIRFYGFDKTVTSPKESFFISNRLDKQATAFEIEITYFDMQHRQLHQRLVQVECEIPPGETRRVDVKSWDTQKAFYFHQSAAPRRQATPFDVRLSLKSLTLIPTTDN